MRIILVGWGVVGQGFAQVLVRRKRELVKDYGFRPRIVAVVDKDGAIINPKGLDLEQLLSLKAEKGTISTKSKDAILGDVVASGRIMRARISSLTSCLGFESCPALSAL